MPSRTPANNSERGAYIPTMSETRAITELRVDRTAMLRGVNVLYGQPPISSYLKLHNISLESIRFIKFFARSPIFSPLSLA